MLVDDLARYENFLFLLGAPFVPLFGVLAADWYVLARRRYDVDAMYRADGPYRGVRWPVVLVWLLGFLVYNWINPGTVTARVSLVEDLFADLLGLPFPLSARLPWLGASIPAFAVAFLAMLAVGRRPKGGSPVTVTFAGMPDEGLAFLEDLEERNTKEFFDANKERVQGAGPGAVRRPGRGGRGLAARQRPRPGPAQGVPDLPGPALRQGQDPLQDVDERVAAVAARRGRRRPGVATGYYVNVGPAGLYTASGLHHPARPDLERVRAAIADPDTGPELEAILRKAAAKGLEPWLDPSSAPPGRGRPTIRRPPQGPLLWSSTASTSAPPAPDRRAARPPARRLEGDDPLQPLAGAGSPRPGNQGAVRGV